MNPNTCLRTYLLEEIFQCIGCTGANCAQAEQEVEILRRSLSVKIVEWISILHDESENAFAFKIEQYLTDCWLALTYCTLDINMIYHLVGLLRFFLAVTKIKTLDQDGYIFTNIIISISLSLNHMLKSFPLSVH